MGTSGRAATAAPSLTAPQASHRSLQPAGHSGALRAQAGTLTHISWVPSAILHLCVLQSSGATNLPCGGCAGEQLRGMFIQTQPTPNPSSLMFLPGTPVSNVRLSPCAAYLARHRWRPGARRRLTRRPARAQSGSKDFANAREGMASPLAKRLFAIEGVTNVFFGSDFVTVTKSEDLAWSMLKPEVFAAIMEHFTSGAPPAGPRSSARARGWAPHTMVKVLLASTTLGACYALQLLRRRRPASDVVRRARQLFLQRKTALLCTCCFGCKAPRSLQRYVACNAGVLDGLLLTYNRSAIQADHVCHILCR